MHGYAWELATLLFVVAIVLYKMGQDKMAKIVTMVLRLAYIAIIATGILIFIKIGSGPFYYLKMLLGLLSIGFMELVIIGVSKKKKMIWQWALLLALFAGTVYLGFLLPI